MNYAYIICHNQQIILNNTEKDDYTSIKLEFYAGIML